IPGAMSSITASSNGLNFSGSRRARSMSLIGKLHLRLRGGIEFDEALRCLVQLHFDGALFAGFFEANLVDHDRGLVRFRLAPDDHAVVAFVEPVSGTIDVIQGRRAQPAMFPNVLCRMGEHENRDAILPTEPFERSDGAAD